jgi:hypothetical protein
MTRNAVDPTNGIERLLLQRIRKGGLLLQRICKWNGPARNNDLQWSGVGSSCRSPATAGA